MRALALISAVLWLAALAGAQELPKAQADFVRFVENENGAALQTGIAGYAGPGGVTVDLIGAIHIADREYYEILNERFKGYDALLYELVGRPVEAREELQAGDGDQKLRWLGQLQEGMRKSLELESQLRVIDYTAKNFVHADMSLDGFFASQEQKKESFFSLWWKTVQAQTFSDAPAKSSPGLARILELMLRKDSGTELKRLIGREFDSVEDIVAGMEAGGGTAIIGERNRHALEVLEREIKAGKKNLGIFYGAAHLPDMEQRLLKRGFELRKVEWLTGWDLPPEPAPPEPATTPAAPKPAAEPK